MNSVSLMPVASETGAPVCPNCGAALVADQRYCLACGAPCSPVRLAFLDVLQDQPAQAGGGGHAGRGTGVAVEFAAAGQLAVIEEGPAGWLRRYSGLLSLLTVLLLCLIVGLLVGHWVTQGSAKAPSKQVVEIKGLTGLPAAAATAAGAGSSTTASETPAASRASANEEAAESKEAAKETKVEKAPPPAPVKVSGAKLQKLSRTTGKQHQEEINALGSQPIETG